jgi:hypothetical protein
MWTPASAKTFNCIAVAASSRLRSTGSPLQQKHKVYLEAVTVATRPENYEEGLVPMFPGAWRRLRLFALEAHDLALSKLERNRVQRWDGRSRSPR